MTANALKKFAETILIVAAVFTVLCIYSFRNSQDAIQYRQKQNWNGNNHNRNVSRQCADRYLQCKHGTLLGITGLSHAHTVVWECCKDDQQSQWEMLKFDPQLPLNPLSDRHQIWRAWLSHGYLSPRKNWAQSVKGFLLPIYAKYTPPMFACLLLFTARCYASAVLAMALCLSVCPSVCLSITSLCSTKTAKRRITQTTPHDSPGL